MTFFTKLNFSSSNEDGETELAALAGAKRMLCITGSGTRPFDLLMSDAEEVIAFDINPAQNALLSLKIAAITVLDHSEYLEFLGISKGEPLRFYNKLHPLMTPAMRTHWDTRKHLIRRGIWHVGKWERLLWWNALLIRAFRGKAVEALMTASCVEAQAQIWDRHFAGSVLRKTIEVLGRDWIWRWVLREPGGAFLPPPKDVARRMEQDFTHASRSFLFRDSDFATLIFKGRLGDGAALPVHLQKESYPHLQTHLPRLRIVEGDLSRLKDYGLADIEGFSVSDFGSYCGPEIYRACWQGVFDVAAPNAKFCERVFMNDMPLPLPELNMDQDFSDRLSRTDKAIIYQLRAGTITRP